MKQLIKGKLRLRIKKECPYYGTGYRTLEKVLFYKCGWSISLWSIHEDSSCGEYSNWAKNHLRKIFPGCEFDRTRVIYNNKTYYPMDTKFLFNTKYQFAPTDDFQVFFERKHQEYVGYSHRACCGFGIGDMLFTGNIKSYSHYYKMPKYRWKYIWTLFKYHVKGNYLGFEDLCEDEIIGHGISQVIPFRDKGIKRIENLEEAYQAACNFARYVS